MVGSRAWNKHQRPGGKAQLSVAARARAPGLEIVDGAIASERPAEPWPKTRLVVPFGLNTRIRLQTTRDVDARIESTRRLPVVSFIEVDEVPRVVAEAIEGGQSARGEDPSRLRQSPGAYRDRRPVASGEEILGIEICAPLFELRVTGEHGE